MGRRAYQASSKRNVGNNRPAENFESRAADKANPKIRELFKLGFRHSEAKDQMVSTANSAMPMSVITRGPYAKKKGVVTKTASDRIPPPGPAMDRATKKTETARTRVNRIMGRRARKIFRAPSSPQGCMEVTAKFTSSGEFHAGLS
jgi:hypothetical protein